MRVVIHVCESIGFCVDAAKHHGHANQIAKILEGSAHWNGLTLGRAHVQCDDLQLGMLHACNSSLLSQRHQTIIKWKAARCFRTFVDGIERGVGHELFHQHKCAGRLPHMKREFASKCIAFRFLCKSYGIYFRLRRQAEFSGSAKPWKIRGILAKLM